MISACQLRTVSILFITLSLFGCHKSIQRKSAFLGQCRNNLEYISISKGLWQNNPGIPVGATPTWDDLSEFAPPEWSNSIPVCPSGGTYTIGPLDEAPRCSIGGPGHFLFKAKP